MNTSHILFAKIQNNLEFRLFFSFFVQNEFDFNKIRLKLHIYFILSIKKEIVDSIFAGLSLSLDMLIYIIRSSKLEADDCRFSL